MNEEENSPNVAPAIRDFVVSMRAIEKAMAEEIRKSFVWEDADKKPPKMNLSQDAFLAYQTLNNLGLVATYLGHIASALEHMSAGMGPRLKIPGLKGAGGGLVL